MAYSADATKEVQKTLATAIDNQDFNAFSTAYTDFLLQFDSFKPAYSKTPTNVPAHTAIFGRKAFHLQEITNEQARIALENSRKASKALALVPVEDRVALLNKLEEKMAKYQDAIITTISADTGKPIDLSKGEMAKGGEWFDFARKQAEEQIGKSHVGKLTQTAKPLGALQVIGAYNYPYALAIGGVVGGLAAGNGVIVSAPMKSPNWVFPFLTAAQEAIDEFVEKARTEGKPWADELAKNAKSLVQTSIGVNTELTANVDVVHFVGSDKVGEIIRRSRGMKPTILEMGGSNVVTVMHSALDKMNSGKIAETIYNAFGPATGQRCTAPRMLCVQEGAEAVTEALKDICDAGPGGSIGNPFKSGIKMGPLVDAGAHQKMQDAIKLATELGATVHGNLQVGSNAVPLAAGQTSFWVNPVVIDWSKVDIEKNLENRRRVQACLRDEIFGPLLHIVHSVKTLDQAIGFTAEFDSHGLAAAIFSNKPEEIERFHEGVSATSISVNGAPKDQSPYGPHGHPGLSTIGGRGHFGLYSSRSGRMDMTPA